MTIKSYVNSFVDLMCIVHVIISLQCVFLFQLFPSLKCLSDSFEGNCRVIFFVLKISWEIKHSEHLMLPSLHFIVMLSMSSVYGPLLQTHLLKCTVTGHGASIASTEMVSPIFYS